MGHLTTPEKHHEAVLSALNALKNQILHLLDEIRFW